MYVHYVVLVILQDLSLSFYCYVNPPVEVDMKEFIDLKVAFTENSYCKLTETSMKKKQQNLTLALEEIHSRR